MSTSFHTSNSQISTRPSLSASLSIPLFLVTSLWGVCSSASVYTSCSLITFLPKPPQLSTYLYVISSLQFFLEMLLEPPVLALLPQLAWTALHCVLRIPMTSFSRLFTHCSAPLIYSPILVECRLQYVPEKMHWG